MVRYKVLGCLWVMVVSVIVEPRSQLSFFLSVPAMLLQCFGSLPIT